MQTLTVLHRAVSARTTGETKIPTYYDEEMHGKVHLNSTREFLL